MATTPVQLQALNESISQTNQSFVKLNTISAPYTSIVNRAKCVDPSSDLLPRMGIDRVMFEGLQELPTEFGSSGEQVFKPTNDRTDRVRFVGKWNQNLDAYGQRVVSQSQNDYVEIVFYGTGLNLLWVGNASARDIRCTVDGGSEGSNIVNFTNMNYIEARNYSGNTLISAVTTTLGLHTVKIRNANANAMIFTGYEVVNSSGTSPNFLQLIPGSSYVGGKKLSKSSLTVDSYNSNFESGALGTRGGRVLVYQKADGSIAKSVNPTNAEAAYLSSANHANEAVVNNYFFREFGAGRGDDFSSTMVAGAPVNKAFTLDDGTTTLVASNCEATNNFFNSDTVVPSSTGFLTFTFVGTGLDLIAGVTAIPYDTFTVTVDGSSVGNVSSLVPIANQLYKVPIASGLPYGTHTVKITRTTTAGSGFFIRNFLVYAPSKPSLPSEAIELAEYNVMANYSTTSAGLETVASGVLRKDKTREFVYTGNPVNWNIVLSVTNTIGGVALDSTTTSNTTAYTFVGTGFQMRYLANTDGANVTVSIDGLTATAANFSSASFAAYGGTTSFNSSTGVLSQANTGGQLPGAGFAVTGLSYGVHTVRFTHTSGTAMRINAIDVISLIHSFKEAQPGDYNNSLRVGSQGISDIRAFSSQSVKPLTNWAQAFGITSNPTTTSANYVLMPDMSVTIKTSGNPVQIYFGSSLSNTTNAAFMNFVFYVNGIPAGVERETFISTATAVGDISNSCIVTLPAGVHKIDVYWRTSTGTMSALRLARVLTAREL